MPRRSRRIIFWMGRFPQRILLDGLGKSFVQSLLSTDLNSQDNANYGTFPAWAPCSVFESCSVPNWASSDLPRRISTQILIYVFMISCTPSVLCLIFGERNVSSSCQLPPIIIDFRTWCSKKLHVVRPRCRCVYGIEPSTPVLVEVRSSCETADFKRDVIWKNFKLSVNAVGKTRAKTYWRLCESQSRKIQVETFLFDIWPAREWWLRRMIIATAVRWTSVAAIDSE